MRFLLRGFCFLTEGPADGRPESCQNVPACKGIALLSEEELAYTIAPDKLMELVYGSRHEV